ncbi:MAG: hypothetical protein M5E90_09155 [Asgard group archaeon]|nr:hypothetical protein [Asgard group archaeon]
MEPPLKLTNQPTNDTNQKIKKLKTPSDKKRRIKNDTEETRKKKGGEWQRTHNNYTYTSKIKIKIKKYT